jgi:hypothetical protein
MKAVFILAMEGTETLLSLDENYNFTWSTDLSLRGMGRGYGRNYFGNIGSRASLFSHNGLGMRGRPKLGALGGLGSFGGFGGFRRLLGGGGF